MSSTEALNTQSVAPANAQLDPNATEKANVDIGEYQYGFHDPTDKYAFMSRKGLDRDIVAQISEMKG
ncbi:MAG: hypothetical protein KDA75_18845, partial [Planctomycetaceae bacterium]|nr:hypothetical protein [Planctomycetaceae bacterium]